MLTARRMAAAYQVRRSPFAGTVSAEKPLSHGKRRTATEMLYRFENIGKSYGHHDILRGVTWQHNPGEKVGLVGRNGAGKTTLLRIALGREEPDAGEFVRANSIRLATVG